MENNEPKDKQSAFKRFSIWFKERSLTILIVTMLLIMLLAFFFRDIFITIHSGQAGVLFKRFGEGTVVNTTYSEGTYFVLPWNKMYIYDIRLQERSDSIMVLSQDGLNIRIDISVRFFPSLRTLGILHRYIGPDYVKKVVMPEIEAKTRDVISKFSPGQIYSMDREFIQDSISKLALRAINHHKIIRNVITSEDPNYVVFENLFIEKIELPLQIKQAIDDKLDAQQKAFEYQYINEAAQKEADRKRIEAQGIVDFERMSGISILKWKGLEATEVLANSKNAKIILVGTDNKLPIILSGSTTEP